MTPRGAEADAAFAISVARRRVVVEVVLATVAVGLVIFAVELLARWWAATVGYGSAAVALAFLGLPLLVARLRGIAGDVHGLSGSWSVGIAWGLGATLVVLGPFALGFDALQVHHLGRARLAGPGLLDFPAHFAGKPRSMQGRITIYGDGARLAFYNGTGNTITIAPTADCAKTGDERVCQARTMAPAARLSLRWPAHNSFAVLADGKPVAAELIRRGELGEPIDGQPIEAPRTLWWLIWALLTQVLVIALPEEAFFRGYVQGRLRAVMPPRHRVFGTPFGAAHVLTAVLFALIHLIANPALSRLLVVFPALLFGWLAERTRSIVAPTTHHALSNLMLQVARRFYG